MATDWRNSTLCPIPWMSQSYRANGDIRVCCQAQHGPTGGILRDEAGTPLNAKTADLEAIRNNPMAKSIRRAMMEGKWHPECFRCKTEESAGIRNRRIYENEIWIDNDSFDWEHLLANTAVDGSIDATTIECSFYDVRFGNLCNLKCRMCGPTDSSQWYQDQVKLWGPQYKDSHGIVNLVKDGNKYVPENNVYDWHESDHFWEQMDRRIPEIRKLYLVGGEPLMIDRHYDFLERCIEQDQAKNIVLEYNSNITNIPQRAWTVWKHFKTVQIGASIDGVGDINHYMRYPSNFDAIHKNLKRLSVEEGNFKVWIAATISVYNVLHFPEFMEWAIRNKMPRVNDDDTKPVLTPHPLHGPKFLNMRMLPGFAKDAVAAKFAASKPILHAAIEEQDFTRKRKDASILSVNNLLDQYQAFMYAEDYSDHLPKFWHATRKLDAIRNHSIEDYIPELYNLIKDTE
jgi:hypothetical protein